MRDRALPMAVAAAKRRRGGSVLRPGMLMRGLLAGAVAVMLMAPPITVYAQDQKAAEAAAAAAAAKAKAEAEAAARARAAVFAKYMQEVKELTATEAKLEKQRIADAEAALKEQQRLMREQVARRDAAERRGKELDKAWADNKAHLEEISMLLTQHQGNLGELFGVTRQVAGDETGILMDSILSTQFAPKEGVEERSVFMRRIAAAKTLPSIDELRRMWYEMQREMTKNGTVARYTAPVLQVGADGKTIPGSGKSMEVTRVGPFSMTTDGEFLGYLSSTQTLTELPGKLPSEFRKVAAQLDSTTAAAHPGYVTAVIDPTGPYGGSLLETYLRRPDIVQRVEKGEEVGYVIIAVGVIGLLLALFQYVYLIRTRAAVKAQLRDLDNPKEGNPLGRLILAFNDRGHNESTELAELRLSEAVLREIPKVERFQSLLRLGIAAGPLLGLIGTVVGMIITFHAIVASGASDPKLMAKGIGQAMIATVLGLSVAIPLLFVNAGLVMFSRSLIGVLDEHSHALLADQIHGDTGGLAANSSAPSGAQRARTV